MKKIKNSAWLVSALFMTIFSACKPDEDVKVETENYKGAIIVNEGGFGKSNASIGIYKPGTGDYFDAFRKANDRPLGDVIQSVSLINGRYYIVVNNSNKIEVVNQGDFKSVATITVTQPRYVLQLSSNKAYISQMNGASMSVLDLGSNTITKTIQVNSSTDHMARMNGRVYVGKAFGDKIYVVNDTTDTVIDSVAVGSGVGNIVNIGSNQIAALCSGFPSVSNAKLVFINKDSFAVERSVDFSSGYYSSTMMFSGGNLFYSFGDNKLYGINSTATIPPPSPVITLASGSVYGFAVDPLNGDLYISDAGDFTNPGKVYIYTSSYSFSKQFTAGIAPGKIIFNY
jgi:hypothetical protein